MTFQHTKALSPKPISFEEKLIYPCSHVGQYRVVLMSKSTGRAGAEAQPVPKGSICSFTRNILAVFMGLLQVFINGALKMNVWVY